MPHEVRVELQRQLAPYRRAHPEVRWTRPETWHLTLLFLGSVDPGKVGLLERTLASVAARGMPYEVRVDAGGGHTGGGRSRRGEGVAWLGLSTGADKLIEVADLVAAACPPDITSGPSPRRTRSGSPSPPRISSPKRSRSRWTTWGEFSTSRASESASMQVPP